MVIEVDIVGLEMTMIYRCQPTSQVFLQEGIHVVVRDEFKLYFASQEHGVPREWRQGKLMTGVKAIVGQTSVSEELKNIT